MAKSPILELKKKKKIPLRILEEDEPRTPEMLRWGIELNGEKREFRLAITDMPLFLKMAKKQSIESLCKEAVQRYIDKEK